MPPHRDKDLEISKASLIAKRKALLKSLAEDSFHEFVRQAWAIVEPDVEYRDNWHIGALCDHLSAVNDGKIKQLLINVPPGAMKSLLVCVFWPAWVWAKSPAKRFLFASYSDGLTMRDSVRCRNILSSDWYQSNWPIKFKDDQNTKGLFENSQGGWRLSTSVGGKGTGLHPDFVCIPHGVRVLSSAGWLPIGQIVDQRMPVRIASWNHERNCIEWKPILAYEKHVGRPCITIRTSGGRTIECTRNHPIYVPGRGYIPAEEVTVGTELYSVREGVLSKEESEGKILREGVLQSVESAQYGGVPCVQEEIQAGSKTCCEARREDLLLKEVLCNNDSRKWASSLSGRGKAHMRHLWERLSGSHLYAREGKRAVLLSALSGQGNGKACGKQEVPALWETFRRYVVRHKKALFPHLCKQGACGEDRRKGKREVCPWERHRGLQHRVSPVAAEDMGVGRVALCVVREDGQAAYAPHQLRQERRQTGESDDLLQLLPRHTARPSAAEGRVEGDYVTEITGAPTPDHVYNLNVDGNHNYFANGILTHNCADDPNNAREAESEADRQNVIDWWDGTISTRGVSRGVSQIVVQQRLHTMDLTGHLMGKGTWDHICLPMRYEADRMKTTSLGFQDPRNRDGDLLWPALFTGDIVERLEKTMGIHHVAGQLQQRPAPRGGGMFKREWFDVLGYEPQFVRMVRFFDKAGCFVAGTMIRTPDGQKPIETMQSGDMVMTHVGPRRVKWAGMTNLATDLETVIFSNGATLTGTPDHPIKLTNGYWSRLDTVGGKDYCCAWPDNQTHCTSSLSLTESDTPEDLGEITTQPWCGTKNEKDTLPMPCTVPSTEACMGPSPVARISTTLTKTTIIIRLRILSASRGASICLSIGRNSRHLPILLSLRASVKKLLSGTVSIKKQTGIKKIARKEGRPRGGERRKRLLRALCAAAYTVVKHIEQAGSALINAKNGCVIGEGVPVYNMEVVGKHEYFANDILAHNTEGGKGARTAGVLMGRTEKGMFVILDVVKERLGAVEREALIKRMAIVDAQRYDGRVTTYVEQEPGSGGKESAEATVRNLAGFDCRIERVTGAKEVRAEPMAAQASVGNVKLLKGKWNEEFLDEIEVFPVGRLKDQCLVAGTMITTTRGQIPIERVTVEDMVLTREGFRRVLWAGMTNPAGVVFQMDLSTGGKLVGTANHPVWAIGRGWVDLANTEGAMVLGWCGPHRVERVQMQKLPMAVYNLTIFDVPEYYANDVLVHNCDAASGALNKLCEVSGAFGQVQAEMPAVAVPASETDFVHSDADFSSGDESFFGK